MKKKTIRIGNASGYWGDDPQALYRQVTGGALDYITMDFLAEVTMSIMRKQKNKNPKLGYATDFLPMLEPVLPLLLRNKTRLICNAGGINPMGCAEQIAKMAHAHKLDVRIAVVHGDDILERIDVLQDKGAMFENMETKEKFQGVRPRIQAANIYFGAQPVAEALRLWAPDIVITGRVTDTGITLAPMIYEFGWQENDWDKLAAGIVAGHLLECGAQATGGNFTDWHLVKNFTNIGYPIAEVSAEGDFVLTKHPGSGGMVSVNTAREQLFYEMGDPSAYLTPDVIADFRSIKVEPQGPDAVKVSGIKGRPPTPFYKVSMAYDGGFQVVGSLLVSGPHAEVKARSFADIFWQRMPTQQFSKHSTAFVGYNSCHKSLGLQDEAHEILLRLGAMAEREEDLKVFGKTIPALILSGPPGVTVTGGVAKPQSVVSYWPSLLEKTLVAPCITLFNTGEEQEVRGGKFAAVVEPPPAMQRAAQATESLVAAQQKLAGTGTTVPLSKICLARSGDKGDTANIGLCGRSAPLYNFIKQQITSQMVKNLFQELCFGEVVRYELDNLQGLNFLLHEALGGGGSASLRTDPQGKTFAQALLRQQIAVPKELLATLPKTEEGPA